MRDGISWKSFSEQAVSTALYDALSEKATRQNLIPVSVMPRYISEKLGIGGDILYPAWTTPYENMVRQGAGHSDGR